MTTPATRQFTREAAPRAAGFARGAVLLAGAAVLLLLVEGRGVQFYWVPLLLGVSYLLAAAAGRSTGPLWAPGWVLTTVGLTEALWFHTARPADSFELAQLTLLAAGTGALLAVAMTLLGVQVSPMSLALAILITGAFNLAEATAVPYVAGNTWLYAGLLAAWGLYEVAAARHGPRPASRPTLAGQPGHIHGGT